jgi:hypothetical protein
MNIPTKLIAVAFASGMAILPAVASAQTVTTTDFAPADSTCLTKAGLTSIHNATTAQVIAVGDCSINVRDTYLDAATYRVSQMVKVSPSAQASLMQTLQTTVGDLATIKTSLDADTSTTTALADYQSIFGNLRVFALVLPRTSVYTTSDRDMTTTANLQVTENNLAARNAKASPAVQAENAPLLKDLSTQIANANIQLTNAENTVQPLVPDQGNKTILASNTAALQSARAMDQTGETDIQAAATDIAQIRTNL